MIGTHLSRSSQLACTSLALAMLVACSPADDAETTDTTAAAASAAAAGTGAAGAEEGRVVTIDTTRTPFARYTGELPCEDCEAVRTELTLWTDPHRYMLSETFVGTAQGDTTLERIGEWLDLRGYPDDPDARVVQLRFETAGDPRNYVMVGGDDATAGSAIRQLDAEQQELPNPESWTLRRP